MLLSGIISETLYLCSISFVWACGRRWTSSGNVEGVGRAARRYHVKLPSFWWLKKV